MIKNENNIMFLKIKNIMSKYSVSGSNIVIGSIGNNSRGSINITNNSSSSRRGNIIGSIGDGSQGSVTIENNTYGFEHGTVIGSIGDGSKGSVTFTNYNCNGVQQGNDMVQVNNYASGPGAIGQVRGGKVTQVLYSDNGKETVRIENKTDGWTQVNNVATGPGAIAQINGGTVTQVFSSDGKYECKITYK